MIFFIPPSSPLQAAYEQVLRPRLDRAATVENVTFDWESLHFVLKRGQLALAAPINGRIITAVFTGTAELDVTPPNPIERQQVEFFLKRDTIAEPFTEAVFRFANGKLFTDALADQVHFHAIGVTGDFDSILADRARTIETDGREEGARMLLALNAEINLPVDGRLFYGELKSPAHGWLEASDDPMRSEPIRVHAWAERAIIRVEPRAFARDSDMGPFVGPMNFSPTLAELPVSEGFDDTWTQFIPPGAESPTAPWRLSDYRLTLTVPRRLLDYQLEGRQLPFTADATLAVAWSPGALVLLRLSPRLRLSAVTAAARPVVWLQPAAPNPSPRDNDTSPDFAGEWLLLQMPRRLELGDRVPLHFEYAPADANDLDYLAHTPLWYPQADLTDTVQRSTFDLVATADPGVRVVAAGDLKRNQRIGDMVTTEWVEKAPAPGFGFILRPKIMDGDQPATATVALADGRSVTVLEQEKKPGLLEVAGNALRFLDRTLGPYPFDTLDLTEAAETWRWQTPEFQSPGASAMRGAGRRFSMAAMRPAAIEYVTPLDPLGNLPGRLLNPTGAGFSRPGGRDEPVWPVLTEVSPLSTWDSTLLHSLQTDPRTPGKHLSPQASDRLLALSPAQAIARQWFGVDVGWAAPGDRWLGDGLATAAALLFTEKALGRDAALATLRQWRTELLGADAYAAVPNDDGALALGPRLASSRDPLGYESVSFEKGAYVVYMLRQMMANPDSAGPDDAFIAMLHEFTSTWAGRDASTADFEALATRYMNENMDLDHNHRLDWFFGQYVVGTLVPHLWMHTTVSAAASGQWQVHLEIDNPDNWRGMLPVDLMKSPTDSQRGWVRIEGTRVGITTVVPFQPTAVVANRFEDMLVRIMNPDVK